MNLRLVALGIDGIADLPFLFGLFILGVKHDFRFGVGEAKSLHVLLRELQQLLAAEREQSLVQKVFGAKSVKSTAWSEALKT